MEDFDVRLIPSTIEADILIAMSVDLMINCHKHELTVSETWNHFVAFGLAGEA